MIPAQEALERLIAGNRRFVAERRDETVRMDRSSMLVAVAKAKVWASEGWKVTIIVGDENEIAPADARRLSFV